MSTDDIECDDFNRFVTYLSDKQIRAFASQAGIAGWMTYPRHKLCRYIRDSKAAQEIYTKNFVERTNAE